jgi:hypothetical protein
MSARGLAGVASVRQPASTPAQRPLSVTGAPPLIPPWLHVLVPIAIVGAWALVISRIRLENMNDLGLVSVIPAGALALLFALTVSFALSVARQVPGWVMLVHVLALVVMLYGITAFIEPEPRFSTVWTHVGIIDYIEHRGTVNPRIDAHFSWPGFFGLGALLTKLAGFTTPLSIAAWGPLAFNLLFLAPLLLIFRSVTDDPRLVWSAVWIFYSTNWVGQDYISPQAVGYLLWLVIAGVLLTWFLPRRQKVPIGRLGRSPPALEDPRPAAPLTPQPASPYARAGLLLLVLVMFAATVTGHQLTPVPEIIAVTALVIFGGLETRGLPLLMILIFLAWIGYMTTAFLSGHIDLLTKPLGSVGGNINQNVGSRIAGSSQHEFIVHFRLLTTGAICALAVVGFARRWSLREPVTALALLGAAPLLLPVLQPYGGEILLRVFLFSLPAVAFFVASLAFPSARSGRSWLTIAALAAAGCLLLLVFQYNRYGNERLDSYTTGDVATVRALYEIAPRRSTLVAGSFNIPWRQRDYEGYEYHALTDLDAWKRGRPNPAALVREVQTAYGKRSVYVVVTRSTKIGVALLLREPRILDRFVQKLRASPAARELYRRPDGSIFVVRGNGSG